MAVLVWTHVLVNWHANNISLTTHSIVTRGWLSAPNISEYLTKSTIIRNSVLNTKRILHFLLNFFMNILSL